MGGLLVALMCGACRPEPAAMAAKHGAPGLPTSLRRCRPDERPRSLPSNCQLCTHVPLRAAAGTAGGALLAASRAHCSTGARQRQGCLGVAWHRRAGRPPLQRGGDGRRQEAGPLAACPHALRLASCRGCLVAAFPVLAGVQARGGPGLASLCPTDGLPTPPPVCQSCLLPYLLSNAQAPPFVSIKSLCLCACRQRPLDMGRPCTSLCPWQRTALFAVLTADAACTVNKRVRGSRAGRRAEPFQGQAA